MLQTYIPLYRKYRPQNLNDLVGQEAISLTLSNAIAHNRVAHAYLFTGPRGTGKTSTARILAKSLNCENGPTSNPCGVCSSCVDITKGTALDIIEIDAASNRSVEDARDLIDRVQFAPVSGRYKVYIIDEVHMLTPQAFNTLLKTLEEPPPNLVFILATTEVHKVLETIISRCQRFDFRRISQDAIVGRLKYIAKEENINISDEALNLIARRSAGGLRDALGLLDQISVLSNIAQDIQIKDVLSLIGALPEDMLIALSDAIASKDGSEMLKIINTLMSLGSEPLQIVKELTIHFRNLLIASTVKENLKDIIDASEEFYDELKNISKKFKQVEIAQIIDKLAYTERMVRNSTQPILWLEVGLLSICYRHEIMIVEELQKRVEELECIVASGSVPPALTLSCESRKQVSVPKPAYTPQRPVEKVVEKPVIPPIVEQKVEQVVVRAPETEPAPVEVVQPDIKVPVEQPQIEDKHKTSILIEETMESPDESQEVAEPAVSISVESIDATWKAIINAISSPPTKGILSSLAVPMGITQDEVVIGFYQELFMDDIKHPTRIKSLEKALETVFGKTPKITFKLLSDKEYNETKDKNITSVPVEEKKIVKPPEPAKIEQVSVDQNEPEPSQNDDEAVQDVDQLQTNQISLNLSEQAKHVQDLFQGKILNI